MPICTLPEKPLSTPYERLKRQVERLRQAEQARKRENPLVAYDPFPNQEAFHRSQMRERWLLGGNRSGKTYAGAIEALWTALGVHPWRKVKVPNSGWIISVERGQSRESAEEAWRSLCPPGLIAREYHEAGGALDKVLLNNGSDVYFKTVAQRRKSFQGAAKTWIWFDEEAAQDVWKEALIRVGTEPLWVWTTMTPLEGFSWSHARLFPQPKHPWIGLWHLNTLDNPYLPREERDRLAAEYTGPEAEARLHGRFVDLLGLGIVPPAVMQRLRNEVRQPARAVEDSIIQGGSLLVYEEPEEGVEYIAAADPSEGDPDPKRDPQCVQVLRRYPLRQVAVWHGKTEADRFGDVAQAVGGIYNEALLAIERNGVGIASLLRARDYPNLYIEQRQASMEGDGPTSKMGWVTATDTRQLMQQSLSAALRDGLPVPDQGTVEELATLVRGQLGRMEGRKGCLDDRALALSIALAVHSRTPFDIPQRQPQDQPEGEFEEMARESIRKAAEDAEARFQGREEEVYV